MNTEDRKLENESDRDKNAPQTANNVVPTPISERNAIQEDTIPTGRISIYKKRSSRVLLGVAEVEA